MEQGMDLAQNPREKFAIKTTPNLGLNWVECHI
jgi:hypothetical protein